MKFFLTGIIFISQLFWVAAQTYPNQNNPNAELHVTGGAASLPPYNVNEIPSQTGFAPYGGATWQAVADNTNGITDYVLEIQGNGTTASPTAMFRLGNNKNQKVHVDVYLRVLAGSGARIGVQGSVAGQANGGYIDLQSGITHSDWRLYSFDIDDAGASDYDLRLHVSASLTDGSGRVQVLISCKDREITTGSSVWAFAGSSTNITYQQGNVGIGTADPGADWKLAVNGKIRAKEIKVETDWADYVFEKDYPLPTLAEVEAHIAQKGHLINIPSAAEVEANGVELGEMNKLLLEKIEELTLYLLELNKKIETKDSKVEQLELQLKALKKNTCKVEH
ncbi:hypothetical protein [Maribacter sp. 2-571]|uniref:hypothetical protein n=1 Tax=Maribacter sp. 2-571 TaxID=3417569 RepID=UPI003D3273EC